MKKSFHNLSIPKPLRIVLACIYLSAFIIFLLQQGFMPMFVQPPKSRRLNALQSDVGTNSVFFLTGNSVTHFLGGMYKKTISPGTIRELPLLNNNNIRTSGSFSPQRNRYCYSSRNSVYQYEKKGKGDKLRVKGKPTLDERYPFTLEYRGLYLQPTEDGVTIRAGGVHNDGYYTSFSDEACSLEDITDILWRNETESITLRELLRVVYEVRSGRLYAWDPERATALFLVYENDESYYLCTVDARTGERETFVISDIPIDDGTFYRLDMNNVLVYDEGNSRVLRWDFRQKALTPICDIPNTPEITFHYWRLDDGSLILGGMAEPERQAWVWIEKTGELVTFNRTAVQNSSGYIVIMGNHSLMVFFQRQDGHSVIIHDFSDHLA